ncbi:MAG: sigma 54-interacting transcriptional regulator [Longimicrobiales bacterium]|nr:sigma 54-interacting transcriptional regulator [Longimicrobiales bacterium]
MSLDDGPRLETLLKALGRMCVLADGELRMVKASEALAERVGRAPESLVGEPLDRYLNEEITGASGVAREVLRTGRRREGLRAFLKAGGERAPMSLTLGVIDAAEEPDARLVLMLRPEDGPEAAPVPSYGGIVARSAAMQRIFRLLELLRDQDSTVLVMGESGTGKELVARAVHDTSQRSDQPFVAVNCAALPSELLESELFGHVRGAFTGAVKDRVGRFELADGGTLFLDEVGSMSLPLQAKILRALQEHTFERVGDTRTRKVDVRIVAATNENLARAVQEHRFREDLYYRLRVVPIEIPPLRERREDIEAITRYLLHRIGANRGRSLRLAPTAMDALMNYAWPGNVRELENALEFATTVCEGQTIHLKHLPVEVRAAGIDDAPPTPGLAPASTTPATLTPGVDPRPVRVTPTPDVAIPDHLSPSEAAEAREILDALARTRFKRQDAARLLGISRTTLWRKMKQYGL